MSESFPKGGRNEINEKLRALELPEDDKEALDNIEFNMMETDPLLVRDNPGLAFFMRKIVSLDIGDSEDVFNKDTLLKIAHELKQIQVDLKRIDKLYDTHRRKKKDNAHFMFMFPTKEQMMEYWREIAEAKKIEDESEGSRRKNEVIKKMMAAIQECEDNSSH